MALDDKAWFDLIARSYISPPIAHRGRALPGFPPDELQIDTTDDAGIETLREAFIFYQDCIRAFSRAGRPLREDDSLLDFGTGWGRIARFFLRELPQENIFGIDVMPSSVDICKRTWRSNNFIPTAPFPPTPIPDGRFHFITGYSVFSHLSEAACAAWMREFHRILRPGGMLALTTRARDFFATCESLKDRNAAGYARALSEMFDDFDAARARYDRGEFVHSNIEGVTGGGVMNATFYGETFIPEQYARTAYAEHFVLYDFLYSPPRQRHPIMFFMRKD